MFVHEGYVKRIDLGTIERRDFVIASIFMTNACNMKCSYCYQGEEKSFNIMNSQTILETIDFLAKHAQSMKDSNVMIVIHGGEPLIAFKEIEQIVKYAKNKIKGVYFSITTNGLLLNDRIEEFLLNEFLHISISLDGTQKSHDTNRMLMNQKGSYEFVIKKFLNLLEKKQDIRARMTFNTLTVHRLFEDVRHIAELGFKTIVPVPDSFDHGWNNNHLRVLREQINYIIDWKAKYDCELEIGLINDASKVKKNSVCSGGTSSLSIDSDGTIYPCTYSVGNKEFVLGQVSTGIVLENVQFINELDKVKNEECVGCSRYDNCVSTRCKIINKLCTGDFHKASPIACNLENIKYESSKYYNQVFLAK